MADVLSYLQDVFGAQVGVISRAQFRKFMGISKSTDVRLSARGQYPRCILGEKILLIDLAKWLEDQKRAEDSASDISGIKKKRTPKTEIGKSLIQKQAVKIEFIADFFRLDFLFPYLNAARHPTFSIFCFQNMVETSLCVAYDREKVFEKTQNKRLLSLSRRLGEGGKVF